MSRYRIHTAIIFGLLFGSSSALWSAEAFRVGFPSLATGFAPSWVAADKGIWRKHGLDVEHTKHCNVCRAAFEPKWPA